MKYEFYKEITKIETIENDEEIVLCGEKTISKFKTISEFINFYEDKYFKLADSSKDKIYELILNDKDIFLHSESFLIDGYIVYRFRKEK